MILQFLMCNWLKRNESESQSVYVYGNRDGCDNAIKTTTSTTTTTMMTMAETQKGVYQCVQRNVCIAYASVYV